MRKIIHCDADCFFAAVEMRDNPQLREIPMAITGSVSRRGVVSTCNYAARRFGVRSAMPTWQAKSLCPHLMLMPHNMEKYQEASRAIHGIFSRYTDQVEKVSVDEAYLDVSHSERHRGSATLLAGEIRERVATEVGITVSAGVAPNKFLAKIASEWRKPDGLFVIAPHQVDAFMVELPVELIQGVGAKMTRTLHHRGIYTCGDLQRWSLSELVRHFGRFGNRLHELSKGTDSRPVSSSRLRKSVSVERTFQQDLSDPGDCVRELTGLHERLQVRLNRLPNGYRIAKINVKIRFSDFSITTVETASCVPDFAGYASLARQGVTRADLPVRLLGLGVQFSEPLEPAVMANQLLLFPDDGSAALNA